MNYTELDALDQYRRDLLAETRHARPERSKLLLAAQRCGAPMSPGELDVLVDEVLGPDSHAQARGRGKFTVVEVGAA